MDSAKQQAILDDFRVLLPCLGHGIEYFGDSVRRVVGGGTHPDIHITGLSLPYYPDDDPSKQDAGQPTSVLNLVMDCVTQAGKGIVSEVRMEKGPLISRFRPIAQTNAAYHPVHRDNFDYFSGSIVLHGVDVAQLRQRANQKAEHTYNDCNVKPWLEGLAELIGAGTGSATATFIPAGEGTGRAVTLNIKSRRGNAAAIASRVVSDLSKAAHGFKMEHSIESAQGRSLLTIPMEHVGVEGLAKALRDCFKKRVEHILNAMEPKLTFRVYADNTSSEGEYTQPTVGVKVTGPKQALELFHTKTLRSRLPDLTAITPDGPKDGPEIFSFSFGGNMQEEIIPAFRKLKQDYRGVERP